MANSESPYRNVPSSSCNHLSLLEFSKWVFLASSVLLSGFVAFPYPELFCTSISRDVITLGSEVFVPTLENRCS